MTILKYSDIIKKSRELDSYFDRSYALPHSCKVS